MRLRTGDNPSAGRAPWRPVRIGAVLALAVLTATGSALAQQEPLSNLSCQELWYQRNSLYKAHGYCFRTADAIRTFGNEGCSVIAENAIRFSPAERSYLNRIILAERVRGCR